MAHHWITYKGKTKTLAEWAKVYHIHADTIRTRLGMGWPIGKALETPSDANASKAHKKAVQAVPVLDAHRRQSGAGVLRLSV